MSSRGEAKIANIKNKMAAIKDATDKAEEREASASQMLREANERGNKFEEERESIIRRLKLLEEDLQKVNQALEEKHAALDEKKGRTQEDQATEKELGTIEIETDEALHEKENEVKVRVEKAEEVEHIHMESCRKHTKCQLDLDRAVNRVDNASERSLRLEYDLKRAEETVKELEVKDEFASEREGEKEEQISFLQAEKKTREDREESAIAEAQKLERIADEITLEIETYRAKTEEVLKQFDDIDDCCLSDDE